LSVGLVVGSSVGDVDGAPVGECDHEQWQHEYVIPEIVSIPALAELGRDGGAVGA